MPLLPWYCVGHQPPYNTSAAKGDGQGASIVSLISQFFSQCSRSRYPLRLSQLSLVGPNKGVPRRRNRRGKDGCLVIVLHTKEVGNIKVTLRDPEGKSDGQDHNGVGTQICNHFVQGRAESTTSSL